MIIETIEEPIHLDQSAMVHAIESSIDDTLTPEESARLLAAITRNN